MKDIDPVVAACAVVVSSGLGKSILWSEFARARAELDGNHRRSAHVLVGLNEFQPIPRVIGDEFRGILIDEIHHITNRLLEKFSDPAFAALDVRVIEQELDKRDPRNRNPRAGRQTVWVVEGAGDPKTFYNKAQARMVAKNAHKRLVAEAKAKNNPVASHRAQCDK